MNGSFWIACCKKHLRRIKTDTKKVGKVFNGYADADRRFRCDVPDCKERADYECYIGDESWLDINKDTIDMVERYVSDAKFFKIKKNDFVNAFAALSYAHGWLDAGARLGIFEVYDSRLFTVDENN